MLFIVYVVIKFYCYIFGKVIIVYKKNDYKLLEMIVKKLLVLVLMRL